MPNPNRDQRLQELAAIAHLYGAVAGPQEHEAQQRQRSAMEMLGLMMQMHQAQQAQALHQQQMEQTGRYQEGELENRRAQTAAETKHWDAEVGRQKEHDLMVTQQKKDSDQLHADELAARAQAGKYGALNMFFSADPEHQQIMADADPKEWGAMRSNIHQAEVGREVDDPRKQAAFEKAMKHGGMRTVGLDPNLMSLHPDVIKGLMEHLPQGAATLPQPQQSVESTLFGLPMYNPDPTVQAAQKKTLKDISSGIGSGIHTMGNALDWWTRQFHP